MSDRWPAMMTRETAAEYCTGDIDTRFWDDLSPSGVNVGARLLNANREMIHLDAYTSHWRERGHLFGLPSRDDWQDHARDKRPIGELVSGLWLTADLHAIHLAEIGAKLDRNARALDAIEGRLARVEAA